MLKKSIPIDDFKFYEIKIMKKTLFWISVMALGLTLMGCGTQDNQWGQEVVKPTHTQNVSTGDKVNEVETTPNTDDKKPAKADNLQVIDVTTNEKGEPVLEEKTNIPDDVMNKIKTVLSEDQIK